MPPTEREVGALEVHLGHGRLDRVDHVENVVGVENPLRIGQRRTRRVRPRRVERVGAQRVAVHVFYTDFVCKITKTARSHETE